MTDEARDRILYAPPPATSRAGAIAALEIARRVADEDGEVFVELAAAMSRVALGYLRGAPDNGFRDEDVRAEDCPVAPLAFEFRALEAAAQRRCEAQPYGRDEVHRVLGDRRDALRHMATLVIPHSVVGVFFTLSTADQRLAYLEALDLASMRESDIRAELTKARDAIAGVRAWLGGNHDCPAGDAEIGWPTNIYEAPVFEAAVEMSSTFSGVPA